MKIGDKIYVIGNSGALIVEETVKDIYTINGVTIYDTGWTAFDERAIGNSIFLDIPKILKDESYKISLWR